MRTLGTPLSQAARPLIFAPALWALMAPARWALMAPALWALMNVLGCDSRPDQQAAVPATPPAIPAPASPPPPAADGAAAPAGSDASVKKSKLGPAPTDGLSLAERRERRKADEAKLASQLADDERQRLLAYDKTKVKLHGEVYAFIKKTRAALDGAKSKADLEKLQKKLEKPIVATGKKVQKIDPKGGNSNVVTDYDVMLNALANDYPEGLLASFDGSKEQIAEQRAEMDKRTKKIDEWLRALKGGKLR